MRGRSLKRSATRPRTIPFILLNPALTRLREAPGAVPPKVRKENETAQWSLCPREPSRAEAERPILLRGGTIGAGLIFTLGVAFASATGGDEPTRVAGKVQAKYIKIAYERFGAPEDETVLLIAGLGAQLTM